MKNLFVSLLIVLGMMNAAVGATGSYPDLQSSEIETTQAAFDAFVSDTCCDMEEASQSSPSTCKSDCNAVLPVLKIALHGTINGHTYPSRAPPISTVYHSEHRPPIS